MKAVEWDAKEHFRQAMIRRNDLDSDGTITIGAKTGWNRERTLTAMAAWDHPASSQPTVKQTIGCSPEVPYFSRSPKRARRGSTSAQKYGNSSR